MPFEYGIRQIKEVLKYLLPDVSRGGKLRVSDEVFEPILRKYVQIMRPEFRQALPEEAQVARAAYTKLFELVGPNTRSGGITYTEDYTKPPPSISEAMTPKDALVLYHALNELGKAGIEPRYFDEVANYADPYDIKKFTEILYNKIVPKEPVYPNQAEIDRVFNVSHGIKRERMMDTLQTYLDSIAERQPPLSLVQASERVKRQKAILDDMQYGVKQEPEGGFVRRYPKEFEMGPSKPPTKGSTLDVELPKGYGAPGAKISKAQLNEIIKRVLDKYKPDLESKGFTTSDIIEATLRKAISTFNPEETRSVTRLSAIDPKSGKKKFVYVDPEEATRLLLQSQVAERGVAQGTENVVKYMIPDLEVAGQKYPAKAIRRAPEGNEFEFYNLVDVPFSGYKRIIDNITKSRSIRDEFGDKQWIPAWINNPKTKKIFESLGIKSSEDQAEAIYQAVNDYSSFVKHKKFTKECVEGLFKSQRPVVQQSFHNDPEYFFLMNRIIYNTDPLRLTDKKVQNFMKAVDVFNKVENGVYVPVKEINSASDYLSSFYRNLRKASKND